MGVFEMMEKREHEQIVFCSDPASGLKAIIGIHDTTLGPALGGVRMWPYQSEDEALIDVLRLSRGMTYKAAAAGLNLGGGKAVIIGDAKKDKSEVLFRAFGRFVQSLHGRYITAEDVGTSVQDMQWINMESDHVTGLPESEGGSGDPSPMTAYGVFQGIRASVEFGLKKTDLKGVKVAVQGIGHVGREVVRLVTEAGGKCTITDIDEQAVQKVAREFNCDTVASDKIYSVDADVFCPCALGAVINDETLPQMKFKIIAGASNNQLQHEDTHGPALHEKGIFYAPDFVINAGGLMNVYEELAGYNRERAYSKITKLYHAILEIFHLSEKEGIPTYRAANQIARKRVENIRKIQKTYVGDRQLRF